MVTERVPEPLIKRRGSRTSFNSHNFSTVDPMSIFFRFSESLEKYLSNDVLNLIFVWGHNLSFFALGPWAITAKLANAFIFQI